MELRITEMDKNHNEDLRVLRAQLERSENKLNELALNPITDTNESMAELQAETYYALNQQKMMIDVLQKRESVTDQNKPPTAKIYQVNRILIIRSRQAEITFQTSPGTMNHQPSQKISQNPTNQITEIEPLILTPKEARRRMDKCSRSKSENPPSSELKLTIPINRT